MIDEEEYNLKKFYDKLYDLLILKKKLKEDSIIKHFLRLSQLNDLNY